VAHQQDAQLISAVGDLVDDQALGLLLLQVLPGTLVHRHDRLVESISMADYYTLRGGDTVAYRPTVHYANARTPVARRSAALSVCPRR
jgi:hypothetical protein